MPRPATGQAIEKTSMRRDHAAKGRLRALVGADGSVREHDSAQAWQEIRVSS